MIDQTEALACILSGIAVAIETVRLNAADWVVKAMLSGAFRLGVGNFSPLSLARAAHLSGPRAQRLRRLIGPLNPPDARDLARPRRCLPVAARLLTAHAPTICIQVNARSPNSLLARPSATPTRLMRRRRLGRNERAGDFDAAIINQLFGAATLARKPFASASFLFGALLRPYALCVSVRASGIASEPLVPVRLRRHCIGKLARSAD